MMLFVVAGQNTSRRRRGVLLLSLLLVAGSVAGGLAYQQRGAKPPKVAKPKPLPKECPIDGDAAMSTLKMLCELGPRISDTPAMKKQQDFIQQHFEKLGAQVTRQNFPAKHPKKGPVTLTNMIVEFNPDSTERILIACHYDTRPFPVEDPNPAAREREGIFIGANDGASGVALLCELGKEISSIKCKYGVDFLFLDAEELIYRTRSNLDDGDPYFLGSKYFAQDYKANPPKHKYKWGVLLDMIADANLELYQEKNSMSWPDTRPLVKDIWGVAKRLGVKEFIDRPYYDVRDDHIPLHDEGGIAICDIIDFAYPRVGGQENYWHTLKDTPENCSGRSMALVGWVLAEWLKSVK